MNLLVNVATGYTGAMVAFPPTGAAIQNSGYVAADQQMKVQVMEIAISATVPILPLIALV